MLIASLSNPTVKHIRSLRQRKARAETGTFFIEGIRLVTEAIQTGAPIELLVVAPELLTSPFAHELLAHQQAGGIARLDVTATVFQSLAVKEHPQGIGAVVRQQWEALAQVRLTTGWGWVALDAVQDPGNLGTILRTCDAVGGSGVMLLGATTDPYDPTALRASMGAIFAQRLVRATFAEFTAWQREHGYTVIGTSDAAAHDYQAVRYLPPLILLMGSEQKGLAPEQQSVCDQMVAIPMVGRSDSLNLAVATGVLLYEIFNQQRHPAGGRSA